MMKTILDKNELFIAVKCLAISIAMFLAMVLPPVSLAVEAPPLGETVNRPKIFRPPLFRKLP